MNTLKKHFIFFAVLCCLYSCNKSDASEEIAPMEIPFTNISQDVNHGGVEKGLDNVNYVITNKTDWNRLINNMDETSYGMYFSEKDIDFSKYRIIAVFDEQHGNGGWSIDITEILEYSDKIVVFVHNLKTGDISSVITNPYHIVKIPYSKKIVEFDKR